MARRNLARAGRTMAWCRRLGEGPHSSEVEHSLGKGEVEGSIPSVGTRRRVGDMNTHSSHERSVADEPVSGSSDRSFGFVIGGALAIFGFWPVVFAGGSPRWWLVVPAALFAVLALTRPAVLRPLNRLWTQLGLLMHRVVNPIVLGVMFFGVITPTGLIARLFGKDLLRMKLDRAATSYWVVRDPPGPEGSTMRNQF